MPGIGKKICTSDMGLGGRFGLSDDIRNEIERKNFYQCISSKLFAIGLIERVETHLGVGA